MAKNADEPQAPKPVFWEGSSKKDLRAFPKAVKQAVGQALYDAQTGASTRTPSP